MTEFEYDLPEKDNLKTVADDSQANRKPNWTIRLKKWWKGIGGKSQIKEELFSMSYGNLFEKFSRSKKLGGKLVFDKLVVMDEIGSDAKSLEIMGEADGKIGQNPRSMQEICLQKALQWQGFLNAAFRNKHDDVKAKWEECKERLDTAIKKRNEDISYQNEIEKRYRFNARKFKRLSGILYVLLAITLLIADFPLSLQVTHHGFGISNKDLFLGIINHNTLLALGIVLITFYIKVYYDEYLGDAISKTVSRFKRENLHGLEAYDDPNDIKNAKRNWGIRFSVKLLILLLLFATIIVLGIFRHELMNESNPEFPHTWSAKWSFILISILIPVTSGVCSSIGVRRLHNYRERKQTQKQVKKSQKLIASLTKELSLLDSQQQVSQNDLEWCSDASGFVKNYSDYFISCYLHGYHRGARDQMPDDLFDFAHKMRGKLLGAAAGQVYTKMVFPNELNSPKQGL